MAVEEFVIQRVEELLGEAERLRQGNEYGQAHSEKHSEECQGWIAAASNIIEMIVVDTNASYRKVADRILNHNYGFGIPQGVGEMAEVLTNLLKDAKAGLIVSVTDRARAEVFDDFLDHAKAYLGEGRKNEAGVISGVVFEDTLRQICRKVHVDEKGRKLDELITELAKKGVLTATKAKRARAAADVRTKATHAQWDEYDDADVKTAIEFTTELIGNQLES